MWTITSLMEFWLRARMISADAPRTSARFIFNREHVFADCTWNPDLSSIDCLTLLTIVSVKDSWFPVEALLSSISTGTTPIHGA